MLKPFAETYNRRIPTPKARMRKEYVPWQTRPF